MTCERSHGISRPIINNRNIRIQIPCIWERPLSTFCIVKKHTIEILENPSRHSLRIDHIMSLAQPKYLRVFLLLKRNAYHIMKRNVALMPMNVCCDWDGNADLVSLSSCTELRKTPIVFVLVNTISFSQHHQMHTSNLNISGYTIYIQYINSRAQSFLLHVQMCGGRARSIRWLL